MAEFRPLGCCFQAVMHTRCSVPLKSLYYNHLNHSSHPKESSWVLTGLVFVLGPECPTAGKTLLALSFLRRPLVAKAGPKL